MPYTYVTRNRSTLEDLVAIPDVKLRKPLAAWAARNPNDRAAYQLEDLNSEEYARLAARSPSVLGILALITRVIR
jgi:hypothetical protein